MKILSQLHIIALACLERANRQRKTLYELMTEANQIFALIDTPYSPGAFYPAMKSLSTAKLININQDGCIIEPLGMTQLQAALLSDPLPKSLVGILYRIMAASILADEKTRTAARKRIEIELIKLNHTEPRGVPHSGKPIKALESARQHIGNLLRQVLLDMSDT